MSNDCIFARAKNSVAMVIVISQLKVKMAVDLEEKVFYLKGRFQDLLFNFCKFAFQKVRLSYKVKMDVATRK